MCNPDAKTILDVAAKLEIAGASERVVRNVLGVYCSTDVQCAFSDMS